MAQKVHAIANGYEILKTLAAQDRDQGVTEIARHTGISPSSSFNILRTLVELGLAKFDNTTKGYSLGLGVFELARAGLAQNPILAAAQSVLVTLAQKHNATLGLWEITVDDEAVLISMGENSSPTRLQLQIGSRQPIAAGATGKAHFSTCSNDANVFKDYFHQVNWQGSISFDEYLQDIDKARTRGYAIDCDNYFLGVSAVAAPFKERSTNRKYCLSAVVLSGAHNETSLAMVGRDLHKAAINLRE